MYPTLLDVPALHLTIPSYSTLILLAVVACDAIGPRWIAALEGLDRWLARRSPNWPSHRLGRFVFDEVAHRRRAPTQ